MKTHPDELARDLAKLAKENGYGIKAVSFVPLRPVLGAEVVHNYVIEYIPVTLVNGTKINLPAGDQT